MKIGLFMAFAGRGAGGPETGEREIVREMWAAAPQHEYHLYCLDRRAPDAIGLKTENVVYHLLEPSFRAVSMLTSLPRAISRTRPDLFHAPAIPPLFFPKNFVMCMPCSSTIRHPEFYPPLIRMRLKFLVHRAIPKADQVICVSEHVREAVHDKFRVPPEQLPVIHPGASRLFRPIDDGEKKAFVEERYGIRSPYFLFSGRWEQRKNVARMLEAFALFKSDSRTEHKLVFTGQRTWASKEADAVIARLQLNGAIVDLGKTPTDELHYLYGAADALVYVSLWEGFGMPIVEAMACGTPVITSNLAAMPETAGNAALLVDPYSVEEIAASMYRIATDADLRAVLRARGLRRASLFTWEKTAHKTLDLYQQIAGHSQLQTVKAG